MRHIDRPGLRISAIVVGLLGLGLVFLTGWDWKAAILFGPWVIILLGYGIFGLFGKVQARTVRIAMGFAMAFIILMWIVTQIFFPLSSVDWTLWLAIPPIIILLRYGIFGLYRTVKPRPTGEPQEEMDPPDDLPPAPRQRWSRNKKTGIGCGIAIILLICAIAGFFAYTFRPAKTLGIKVHYPKTVQVGDSFELTLYLNNTGDEDFEVQTIQLGPAVSENYDSILTGATVTSTEPDMNCWEISSEKTRVYQYFQILKPGETQRVIFDFQAVNAGTFETDVDILLSDSWSSASDILITIAP